MHGSRLVEPLNLRKTIINKRSKERL